MLQPISVMLFVVGPLAAQKCQNNGTWDDRYRLCLCTYMWTGDDCSKWKHHMCYFDDGFEYRGYLSRTIAGLRCAPWSTDSNVGFPLGENGIDHHNHCRNPGHDPKGLWCYVDGPQFIDYCNATVCPESYKSRLNVTGIGRGKTDNVETVRFVFGPLISAICGGVVVIFVVIGVAEYIRRRRLRSTTTTKHVKSSPGVEDPLKSGTIVTVNMDTGETQHVNKRTEIPHKR